MEESKEIPFKFIEINSIDEVILIKIKNKLYRIKAYGNNALEKRIGSYLVMDEVDINSLKSCNN